jgi:hypothetical protein
MALSVILFSILLSTGIGAYLSGRLFGRDPYKAILISIPPLIVLVLLYYFNLQGIIDSSFVIPLTQRIALTFFLLFPAGFLMGFQFPSIIRMASYGGQSRFKTRSGALELASTRREDITLLWGVNIIASVVGTVLSATLSMIIGFNGNLLIGAGLYLGAIVSAIAAQKLSQRLKDNMYT